MCQNSNPFKQHVYQYVYVLTTFFFKKAYLPRVKSPESCIGFQIWPQESVHKT